MDNETRKGIRATQKAATRTAVLNAAKEEFERVGFQSASVRTIAKLAGVSPGTVIHHYGEKTDLLHAAFFEDLDDAIKRGLAPVKQASIEQQLTKLTRAVFKYYQRRPQLSRTLLKESLFADPPWKERFQEQTTNVHVAIVDMGIKAIARGELREGTDLRALGAAYLSFFYFALLAWAQGAVEKPAQMVGTLVAQHLEGLRPEQPANTRR